MSNIKVWTMLPSKTIIQSFWSVKPSTFYIISKSISNSISLQRSIIYILFLKTNKKPYLLSDSIYLNV